MLNRVAADIIRPRFMQSLVAIHFVGVGDPTTLWRVSVTENLFIHQCRAKRFLLAACLLCRLRRQRCVESPHPTKDIEKLNKQGKIGESVPQPRCLGSP